MATSPTLTRNQAKILCHLAAIMRACAMFGTVASPLSLVPDEEVGFFSEPYCYITAGVLFAIGEWIEMISWDMKVLLTSYPETTAGDSTPLIRRVCSNANTPQQRPVCLTPRNLFFCITVALRHLIERVFLIAAFKTFSARLSGDTDVPPLIFPSTDFLLNYYLPYYAVVVLPFIATTAMVVVCDQELEAGNKHPQRQASNSAVWSVIKSYVIAAGAVDYSAVMLLSLVMMIDEICNLHTLVEHISNSYAVANTGIQVLIGTALCLPGILGLGMVISTFLQAVLYDGMICRNIFDYWAGLKVRADSDNIIQKYCPEKLKQPLSYFFKLNSTLSLPETSFPIIKFISTAWAISSPGLVQAAVLCLSLPAMFAEYQSKTKSCLSSIHPASSTR